MTGFRVSPRLDMELERRPTAAFRCDGTFGPGCRLASVLCLGITLAIVGAISSRAVAGQTSNGHLFNAAPDVKGVNAPTVQTVRRRWVTVDFKQLPAAVGSSATVAGALIRLNLFDDTELVARIARSQRIDSTRQSWSGTIDDVANATFTFVVGRSRIIGSVRTPTAVFEIRPAPAPFHEVRQLNALAFPAEAPPIPAGER